MAVEDPVRVALVGVGRITDLHADRIGHGFYLMDSSMVADPAIEDKQAYVESLVQKMMKLAY